MQDLYIGTDSSGQPFTLPASIINHTMAILAKKRTGKALALDTLVPTPRGWTTTGELAVGDLVYDERGCPTRVVAATDPMHGRPCYKVSFSDGTTIIADAEHSWWTEEARVRIAQSMCQD